MSQLATQCIDSSGSESILAFNFVPAQVSPLFLVAWTGLAFAAHPFPLGHHHKSAPISSLAFDGDLFALRIIFYPLSCSPFCYSFFSAFSSLNDLIWYYDDPLDNR
jgi:hypothetical protein